MATFKLFGYLQYILQNIFFCVKKKDRDSYKFRRVSKQIVILGRTISLSQRKCKRKHSNV